MKSRQFFSPPVFRAMIFALAFFAPGRGFADADASAIASAQSVEAAQSAYMAAVSKLSDDAKAGGKVKQGLIDSILAQARENSQKTYSSDEIATLRKEAEDAKAKEQSTANKMLGGLTMAATGIGGMQLMQGMAEKKADEDAAADMAAYLSTIKCGISGGAQGVKYNEAGHTPPETRDLADARLEYTVLAKKIKTAKENLGMQPGIESELVIVDTTKGLYDNAGTDTGGITHHFDTGTERADSGSGQKRMIAGGVAAGAGVVGGVVGNAVINKKDDGKKDEKGSGGILDKVKDLASGLDIKSLTSALPMGK
jgi:hypothetical protein